MFPCQHCQSQQELNTLKQQKKSLEDIPPSQRNYTWRKDWNQNQQQELKIKRQLIKSACNCEDWNATTPVNNQPFTFEVPKFEAPKSSPSLTSDQQTEEYILNFGAPVISELIKQFKEANSQREREREREREQFRQQVKQWEKREEELLDDLLKLHAELEHEKESHEDTKDQAQWQATLSNGCLHQLESQIKKLTDHRDTLIKQAAEQQDKLLEHQQFEASQKVKINHLQALLNTTDQELVQAKKSNKKISKKLERQGLKLAQDQAKKKYWKEKWENDQSIIAGLILKNQNYQSIIKQKDQQLKSKRIEINRNKSKLLNKQQAEISNLKTDNHNLNTQLQQEKNRADNLQVWKDNHVCSCPNICCANGDYDTVKQQRDNYQQQLDNHICPTPDNSELESLRQQVQAKNTKISELEQEIKALKDKPPVVDNSEVERLLAMVEEKEKVIRELEVKLAAVEPQVIKVESEEVQALKNRLTSQEKRITRLHVIYLLILSTAALAGLVRFIGGRISKKKPR